MRRDTSLVDESSGLVGAGGKLELDTATKKWNWRCGSDQRCFTRNDIRGILEAYR